ncbi:Mediator of RNA polymerase II transcription subunit 10 [Trichostrongylus colubriformis]|uniref:Mediator of RNA polymerase II transcription subunit 10 n=1 Tax=Trichostrongylus colubriformis TaxID=6319 RepID=A0AAN8IPJ0_TRICO
MRSQFMDVKVPLELLDVLDQGKNPQLYTKEVLERTLLKNKEVNGKVETYKKFHAALLKELGEEMPEDTMTYRNIRDIMDKHKIVCSGVMSIWANPIFRPQNAASAALIRFVPNFVSLRLSWTHNSLKSEGVEQFVEEFLPIIREHNPQVKYFLHRTYTECDPFVVGEYTWLRHRKKRASWRSVHQVLSMVEEMAVGGDYRPGLKRGVNSRLPRGQELWDTETIGHDVFKVHSKWKADEEDLDMPTSQKHPHFVYRKY